jgi:regulator of protease activity HflC (stomatin/prohibitin superfamily)
MLGYRFIKTQPTQYVIQYRNGEPRRQGAGLAFWYFQPTTSIVVVPTASVNEPFIFEEVTSDFQEVTVQGQVTYRVADPRSTATLLNFALDAKGKYVSEDPQKLSQRLIDQVQVAMRAEIQALSLKQSLASGEALVGRVSQTLSGLGLIASTESPSSSLEAEAREALL